MENENKSETVRRVQIGNGNKINNNVVNWRT